TPRPVAPRSAGRRQPRPRAAAPPSQRRATLPAAEATTPARAAEEAAMSGAGLAAGDAAAATREASAGEGPRAVSAAETGRGEEVPEPGAPTEPRRRERGTHGNALGMLIEQHFTDAASPCRSYSDLERHSTISREALSRYVTARPDRR